VVFRSSFVKIKTKFDADSLLLKIGCKKIAGSLKHNLTKLTELNNTSSQLHNWWHTDSQSILLATYSGGRAYDNRFGALFKFPEFLGSTTHTCNFIAYKMLGKSPFVNLFI
jgi:hypothetical protein